MIIQVDTREKDLILQMNILISTIPLFKDIKLVVESLPLADIIFVDEETTNLELFIERKSVSDLLSSIKDGRYEEQSYRLDGLNHHNHNVIYLVEGDVNKVNRFKDSSMEKLTLYSAIFSLNYYKGFSVIRTFNIEESAIFLCNTFVKLNKGKKANKKAYYKNVIETSPQEDTENQLPNLEKSDKDYVNVIKKVKKENITSDNIGEIMLCQIPGISSVTALAIMKQMGSLPKLLKELENEPNCLKDISYINAAGQTRKINKSTGETIIKYLLNP